MSHSRIYIQKIQIFSISSDKCEIVPVYVTMFAVIFDRNGAKVYVRGVLGNKCAGQHNMKTLHFKETIVSA
jgi:hypothetical protein